MRFYDDKSLYTGVHAHGGPSTIDVRGGKTFSEYDKNEGGDGGHQVKLEDLLDRSSATVRGLNKK